MTVCVDEVEPSEATEFKEEEEEERTNPPDSWEETSDISSSISDSLAILTNDRIDGKGKRNEKRKSQLMRFTMLFLCRVSKQGY